MSSLWSCFEKGSPVPHKAWSWLLSRSGRPHWPMDNGIIQKTHVWKRRKTAENRTSCRAERVFVLWAMVLRRSKVNARFAVLNLDFNSTTRLQTIFMIPLSLWHLVWYNSFIHFPQQKRKNVLLSISGKRCKFRRWKCSINWPSSHEASRLDLGWISEVDSISRTECFQSSCAAIIFGEPASNTITKTTHWLIVSDTVIFCIAIVTLLWH